MLTTISSFYALCNEKNTNLLKPFSRNIVRFCDIPSFLCFPSFPILHVSQFSQKLMKLHGKHIENKGLSREIKTQAHCSYSLLFSLVFYISLFLHVNIGNLYIRSLRNY